MQERLFELLFEKDEVSWQTMLYELVRTEKMDPWDIDISLLSQRFMDMIKQFKKMDFRISGKIILAAAVLLKIKSNRLVNEDISNFDRMFSQEDEEGLLGELIDDSKPIQDLSKINLLPQTPQPRKRKVSIYDLVNALQNAMEVKKRKVMRDIPPAEIKLPERKIDITSSIKNLYEKIKLFFAKEEGKKLTFSNLVPSQTKQDKIYTFIPLLHLTTQRKVDLFQAQHFGEIEIQLMRKMQEKETDKEISEELDEEIGEDADDS